MIKENELPHDGFRSGTNPLIRAQFTKDLTQFLSSRVKKSDVWPGIKSDDLIAGIIDALKLISNQFPHGMGIALLLALSYAAQDEALQPDKSPVSEKSNFDSDQSNSTHEYDQKIEKSTDFKPISFSGQTHSPLFKIGYSVAANDPSDIERRKILTSALQTNPDDAFSSSETLMRWGDSNTPRRLFAIASFLVWLIDFQGGEKSSAKEKWNADLNWIKEEYYDFNFGFTWPKPSAEQKQKSIHPTLMQPMKPSSALSKIIGSDAISRVEVTKRVWEYIKSNKLQDLENKRNINADQKLQAIFGKSQVTMFEMTKLINAHLHRI